MPCGFDSRSQHKIFRFASSLCADIKRVLLNSNLMKIIKNKKCLISIITLFILGSIFFAIDQYKSYKNTKRNVEKSEREFNIENNKINNTDPDESSNSIDTKESSEPKKSVEDFVFDTNFLDGDWNIQENDGSQEYKEMTKVYESNSHNYINDIKGTLWFTQKENLDYQKSISYEKELSEYYDLYLKEYGWEKYISIPEQNLELVPYLYDSINVTGYGYLSIDKNNNIRILNISIESSGIISPQDNFPPEILPPFYLVVKIFISNPLSINEIINEI